VIRDVIIDMCYVLCRGHPREMIDQLVWVEPIVLGPVVIEVVGAEWAGDVNEC
jgi:hypothetical protein